MKTAEKIKMLLAEKGWSQSRLATESNVSQPNINNILNNKQSPSNKTLGRIANALGVSVYDLVDDGRELSLLDNQVCGYLEFGGEITRITSLRDVHKWLTKYNNSIEGLQKEYSLIKAINKRNKIKVEKKQSSYDFSRIDLFQHEVYDCTRFHVWSFRKAEDCDINDEGEELTNNLGNMCKGYPFELCGHRFHNSESAYICGLFSTSSQEHIDIQRELQDEASGYSAKKDIRHRYKDEAIPKGEWETFNVQWMLYVIWCKCQTNKEFRDLLVKIPYDAIIVENVSFQHLSERNITATFWGARNEELRDSVKKIERYIEYMHPHYPKRELAKIQMEERTSIKYIGKYEGVNCMGKILKICQVAIINKTEPAIDYELLRSKRIHLFGTLLDF